MDKDRVYSIADKLYSAFEPSINDSFFEQEHRVQFGIIINKSFRLKGKSTCLNSLYAFEDSSYITNLIIKKLTKDIIPEVDLDDLPEVDPDDLNEENDEEIPF